MQSTFNCVLMQCVRMQATCSWTAALNSCKDEENLSGEYHSIFDRFYSMKQHSMQLHLSGQ